MPGLRGRRGGRPRPDREEAPVPRGSGLARLLDLHDRLPVPLRVLPELGDRPGPAARPGDSTAAHVARADRRERGARRRPIHRLHLRRADRLPGVRARHRPARAAAGPAQPVHHGRLRHPRGRRPPRRDPRRRQRRSQELRRCVLPAPVRRPAGPRARRDRRLPRRRHLAGADHAGHPGQQRLRRRAARAGWLDRRDPGLRHAVAREPVPPGLPDAGRTAHAARNPAARRGDRTGGRPALRLCRATRRSSVSRTRGARAAACCSWSGPATARGPARLGWGAARDAGGSSPDDGRRRRSGPASGRASGRRRHR